MLAMTSPNATLTKTRPHENGRELPATKARCAYDYGSEREELALKLETELAARSKIRSES